MLTIAMSLPLSLASPGDEAALLPTRDTVGAWERSIAAKLAHSAKVTRVVAFTIRAVGPACVTSAGGACLI